MKISELETPCLLLDKNKVQRNMDRMQHKLDKSGVVLRPHGKTAKNIDVINMLAPHHRCSITVSTLKEAEYFFDNGISDILYAVGITPCKLDRVAELIRQGANLTIILDSLEQVDLINQFALNTPLTINALIEIDCDGERAGIEMNDPALIDIAKAMEQSECLRFKGVMTHAGGSYHCCSKSELVDMAEQERMAAIDSARRLRQAGLRCDVISIGSTPTALFSKDFGGVTEVRAGVFMFFDLVMVGLGVCDTDEVGLSVLTSIIGRNQSKNWLLVDAGWMALSRDRGTSSQTRDYRYGLVCNKQLKPLSDLVVASTNQEHGIIDCNADRDVMNLPISTRLAILPNHACSTAAMHDKYYVTDDGESISHIWHRVSGW